MTEHWTLDKRVPVALIIAMASQLCLGGWFVSKFDSRLINLENSDRDQAAIITAVTTAQNQTNVSLAEIKKDQSYTVDALKEIKTKLNKGG